MGQANCQMTELTKTDFSIFSIFWNSPPNLKLQIVDNNEGTHFMSYRQQDSFKQYSLNELDYLKSCSILKNKIEHKTNFPISSRLRNSPS